MARKNPLDKAREDYEKALASVHIDIGSHNKVARKPRVKATRKTTPRRAVRKVNPINPARAAILKEYKLALNAAAKEKDELSKAVTINYGAGLLHAANLCGVLSDEETHTLRESLKKV